MARDHGRVDAVIFDYGGVLTTPGRDAIAAWTRREGIRPESFSAVLKQWLSRDAPPGNPLHLLETGELPAAEFNRVLAEQLSTDDGRAVEPEGLLSRLFSHMDSDPAMLRLVGELRAAGTTTALLSNSWGNNYPWDTLHGLFDAVVISSEVGLRKPDPRIYRLALRELGLPAEHTAFVDDGAPNVETAGEIGMRTILHSGARQTRSLLAGLVPGLKTTDPQESA